MDKAKAKTGLPFDFVITRQEITDIVLSAMGFFIGRVVVFNTVNPVGIAYITPFFMKGKAFYICSFFMLLGMLTRYNHFYSLKYFICIGALISMQVCFKRRVRNIGEYMQAAIVSSVLVASGIIVAIINNGSFYLGLMAVMEGILSFTFGIIFFYAISCIKGKSRVSQKTLENEELISVSALVAAAVAGGADIFVGYFSFRYFFCYIIVMVMAREGGAAIGSATGMLLGTLIHISGYEPVAFAVIISMSGLFCGCLRTVNKPVAAIGFIVGGVITSIYFKYQVFRWEQLVSALFSICGFIFIQPGVVVKLPLLTNSVIANQNNGYPPKSREIVTSRLNAYSESFGRLSKSFGKLSERKTNLNKKDVANIIDDTAARVCAECKNAKICWIDNLYTNYQYVYTILAACEKNGKITANDIPDAFRWQCINVSYFTATISRYFELYRQNIAWRNKIAEIRRLAAEQIEGVSSIIHTLSEELNVELNFNEKYEKALLQEFDKNRIEVENLIVLENLQGLYEVTINRRPCYGKRVCDRKIIPIITRILGRAMRREDKRENCTAKGVCRIRLIEEQRYIIACGISRSSKDFSSESGDSYSFMELKNGQCMLALSDGMGSGKKARQESSTAIELLEEFMEAGFDKNTAVKFINSVLLLRSGDDSFSTLDICSLNLHTGDAEFIKIGASSTFLIRDGNIDIIRSWSLPAGIVDAVDVDVSQRKLSDNDIIVMVTDGVLDSDTYESEKENWIIRALTAFKGKNPQDISDFILSEAKKNYGASAKDDMTVLVAKIWEKS